MKKISNHFFTLIIIILFFKNTTKSTIKESLHALLIKIRISIFGEGHAILHLKASLKEQKDALDYLKSIKDVYLNQQ